MAAITITFSNVALSSTNTAIALQGGSYSLGMSDGFTLSGTVTFNSLAISTGNISFNVASGTTFNGSVVVDVTSATSGSSPEIQISNFSTGTVNVSWPTNSGTHNQNLEPGNPLPLSGYNG